MKRPAEINEKGLDGKEILETYERTYKEMVLLQAEVFALIGAAPTTTPTGGSWSDMASA